MLFVIKTHTSICFINAEISSINTYNHW